MPLSVNIIKLVQGTKCKVLKCSVYAALLILCTPTPSYSAVKLFKRPLKIYTCELLLRSQLQELSTKESTLASLRDISYNIQKAIPESQNNGEGFEDLSFDGPVKRIGPRAADKIVQRINAIEKQMMSPDLDGQIVSFEIRGDSVRKALENIEGAEDELLKVYENQLNTIYSRQSRLAMRMILVFVAYLTIGNVDAVIDGLQHFEAASFKTILLNAFSVFNNVFLLGIPEFNHMRQRFDWDFHALKGFLRKITSQPSVDDILILSESITMPVDFNRGLLSAEGMTDEARAMGLERWGGTHSGRYMKMLFGGKLMDFFRREVQNAGDSYRNVYFDNFVYFDKGAQEPVWVLTYRAFRNQPAGRKPSQPKEQQKKTHEESGLVPGLAPIPVRF